VDNLSVPSLRVKSFKRKLRYGIITLCLVISKKGADHLHHNFSLKSCRIISIYNEIYKFTVFKMTANNLKLTVQ